MVMFFMLFGAACSAIGDKAKPVLASPRAVSEVMFRYTKYVMYVAPFGVGAAIAVTIGTNGIGVLLSLGKLVGTLYLAQFLFVVLVLGSALTIARVPIGRFWMAARQPFILAFSTASSEAALPLALENMERFGVPKHIVGFVLPTGYSFNLDGSTLYLSLASMFVAQAAGVHMPLGNADHDDADVDADQQGRRRRSPSVSGDPGGHVRHIQSATRRHHADPRRRCVNGYVPDIGEPFRQLRCDSGRGALGGRAALSSWRPG